MDHSLMHFASKSKAIGALRTLGLFGESLVGRMECAVDPDQMLQVEEVARSNEVHDDARQLANKIIELPADTVGIRYFSLSYLSD